MKRYTQTLPTSCAKVGVVSQSLSMSRSNVLGSTEFIPALADRFRVARSVVVMTGAGISTESGVPAFRGPGGVWENVNPASVDFKTYLNDPESRRQRWEGFRRGGMGADSEPNSGHVALTRLTNRRTIDAIITQNVDGLHSRSGLPDEYLIEIHGSARFAKCVACKRRCSREDALAMPLDSVAGVPLCTDCGGFLKAGSVSFGEPMPEDETRHAIEMSKKADLFLVIGSSLVVRPAAHLPLHSLRAGGTLAIINQSETPLDGAAWAICRDSAGTVLTALASLLLDSDPTG